MLLSATPRNRGRAAPRCSIGSTGRREWKVAEVIQERHPDGGNFSHMCILWSTNPAHTHTHWWEYMCTVQLSVLLCKLWVFLLPYFYIFKATVSKTELTSIDRHIASDIIWPANQAALFFLWFVLKAADPFKRRWVNMPICCPPSALNDARKPMKPSDLALLLAALYCCNNVNSWRSVVKLCCHGTTCTVFTVLTMFCAAFSARLLLKKRDFNLKEFFFFQPG